jgi:hypothetical protein
MELNIIESTQQILDQTNYILIKQNKKYYRDVLDFLNLLFEDDAKNISKIQFKKITLNLLVFTMYNEIIKVYNLKKPLFDSDNFDLSKISILENCKDIFINIALKFSNNLLEKINYKLLKKNNKNENDKIKLFLQHGFSIK